MQNLKSKVLLSFYISEIWKILLHKILFSKFQISPHVLISYWQIVLVVSKIRIPFHKLTFIVLKQHFPKQKLRVVIHRQYKNFCNGYFRIELENALLKYDFNNIDSDNFIKTFLTVLDKYAPIKKKCLRANYVNFVTKQLTKAIIKRSKLRNDFLKDRNEASQSAYRKQPNLCETLLWKAKKQYFSNLEHKLITDNKKFWKSVKPFFSDKITVKEIIKLTVDEEILSLNTDIGDLFNDYFSNVVQIQASSKYHFYQ